MKMKSFVAGFILACFMFAGVFVFADTGFMRQINAYIGGVDLVMDGVKIVPKDVNGKLVLPITYEGTTYVPIRFLSAVMNKKVAKVGDVVYLGQEDKINAIHLSELTPVFKSDNWSTFGPMGGWTSTVNPYNESYSTVTYSKSGSLRIAEKEYGSVSSVLSDGLKETKGIYKIDKKYSKITGYFGIDDFSTDLGQSTGKVEIYGDGKLLRQIIKSRGQEPEFFEIDLTDVEMLNINVIGDYTLHSFSGKMMPISQTVCDLFDVKLYVK